MNWLHVAMAFCGITVVSSFLVILDPKPESELFIIIIWISKNLFLIFEIISFPSSPPSNLSYAPPAFEFIAFFL